jgi:hypothetical protein
MNSFLRSASDTSTLFRSYVQLRYSNFLCLLILFSASTLWAQAPTKQWDKTFGGSAYDEAKTVIQCSDGGFLFVGYSLSGISGDKTEVYRGDRDCWLIKTDANGNKQWDKTLGGNGEEIFASVIQTSDGGFLLAGFTSSDALGDISAPNKGYGSDYWIVKISSTGVKQWDKRYGGNQSEYITSAKQTSDGGYILAGYSFSGQSGDKSEPSRGLADYWILKISNTGIKQWDKTIGGSSADQSPSIIQTFDGSYLVAGWSESGVSGDKSEPSRGLRDYWLVKLTQNGAKEWDKTFGGSGNDEPSQLMETLYGYMMSGTSTSGISGDKTEPNKGAQDFWIVKTNIFGDMWWDRTYGGGNSDGNSSVIEFYDGYLFSGYSNSGISGDKTEASKGLSDFWLVKTDFDGNKLWDKTFGGSNDEYAYSAIQTADAGVLLAGMSKSGISGDKTTANKGSADYWIVKLTPDLPEAPTLSVHSVSRTAVDIAAFDANSYECYYEEFVPQYIIEKATSINGPYSVKDTLDIICYEKSVRYADNYLLPNTTYYYRVKAIIAGISSPYSPAVSTTTMSDVTSPVNIMAEWNKRFGGTQDETLQATLRTTDGGYLLAGSSRSGLEGDRSETSRGGLDFWIVKLSANGTKLWDKRYGGTGYDGLHAAIQTTDGGFLLAGTSSSIISGDKSEGNRGAGDYWIVKISSSGVKEWDKTYGGSALEELRSVLQTSDGGYLIGGYSLSGISGDKTEGSRGESDYWLVKVTSSGVKQWDKRFGGSLADELSTLTKTPDGNYLIGGTTRSTVSGDVSQARPYEEYEFLGYGDYWIVKISSNGTKLWDKRFGGEAADLLKTIIPTTDGGFLLGGSSKSKGSWTDNVGLHFCYWIIKINNTGVLQWDKAYKSEGDGGYLSGETYSYLNSITPTPDGGYLIAGSSQSDISTDKSEGSRGIFSVIYDVASFERRTVYSFDYWIIKITTNGERQWDKTFGGFGEDNLATALYNPDGSVLLAGYSTSPMNGDKTQASQGKADFWIVKTKPSTQTPIACTASGTILREVWSNITGTAVSTIPVNNIPTNTGQLTLFEAPSNAGDNYGQRLRGYICVPQTGNYTFWIAGDNNCELWISTDDTPAKKVRIAHITGSTAWAEPRNWTKYTSQQSVAISLQAGKRYYIEALHKENMNGDNLAVGWQLPNGTLERPIPGSRLSPVVLPNARISAEDPEEHTLSLQIYPNPSKGDKIDLKLTDLAPEAEIIMNLYNGVGNNILKSFYKADSYGSFAKEVVFTHKLPSGVYTLVIQAGSQHLSKKLIIAR